MSYEPKRCPKCGAILQRFKLRYLPCRCGQARYKAEHLEDA